MQANEAEEQTTNVQHGHCCVGRARSKASCLVTRLSKQTEDSKNGRRERDSEVGAQGGSENQQEQCLQREIPAVKHSHTAQSTCS